MLRNCAEYKTKCQCNDERNMEIQIESITEEFDELNTGGKQVANVR